MDNSSIIDVVGIEGESAPEAMTGIDGMSGRERTG